MRNFLLSLVMICFASFLPGQSVIMLEDFEDATVFYTTSVAEFTDGETDYFTRTDGTNVASSVQLTNIQGTSFFGAQDTDGPSGNGPDQLELSFENIDISGFTNLAFSLFIGEDDDGSQQDWDDDASLSVSVSIDNGPNQQLFIINAPSTNTEPRFNGTSIFITDILTEYSFDIIGTGDEIDITIFINNLNAGDEDIAFDNIKLIGLDPTIPAAGFDTAGSTENETNTPFNVDVPVTLSNYQGSPVDLAVNVTGGSAEITDYILNTTSLSFTGDGSQNVSLTLNDDAGFDDETIELTISETTTTGAVISIETHTITLVDDEEPPLPNVRINEVDSDTQNNDDAEFIELYGTPNLSLDGLVVVFFNGNIANDASYRSIDLDGYTLDSEGFFILGSSNAPGNPEIDLGAGNQIQNGADAVALYMADASDFPASTPPTTINLIDALVYDTNDADDLALLNALGQAEQINENQNGSSATQSIQRGSWFVSDPTPRMQNIVPVSLKSFNAKERSKKVNLHWTTASEINNDFFEVQRSTDHQNFETIGKVKGNGTTSQEQVYEFTDRNPASGINYYRLAQYDFNGDMEYHKVISVELRGNNTIIYPTLTADLINVEIGAPSVVHILTIDGKLIDTHNLEQSDRLDVSKLPAGLYYLSVQTNGNLETHRFIKK